MHSFLNKKKKNKEQTNKQTNRQTNKHYASPIFFNRQIISLTLMLRTFKVALCSAISLVILSFSDMSSFFLVRNAFISALTWSSWDVNSSCRFSCASLKFSTGVTQTHRRPNILISTLKFRLLLYETARDRIGFIEGSCQFQPPG